MSPTRPRRPSRQVGGLAALVCAGLLAGCGLVFEQHDAITRSSPPVPVPVAKAEAEADPLAIIAAAEAAQLREPTPSTLVPIPTTTLVDSFVLDDFCREAPSILLAVDTLGNPPVEASSLTHTELIDDLVAKISDVAGVATGPVSESLEGLSDEARVLSERLELLATSEVSGVFSTFAKQAERRIPPILELFDRRCPLVRR